MDFETDAKHDISLDEAKLTRLTSLVDALKHHEEWVEQKKEELRRAEAERDKVKREDIPALMAECGLEQVKTLDGATLSVKHMLKASVTQANLADAVNWLRSNHLGDIVKHGINCDFKMGEQEDARTLSLLLSERGYKFNEKMSVHPQTISAVCRDMKERGEEIPPCISVYEYDEAKVR